MFRSVPFRSRLGRTSKMSLTEPTHNVSSGQTFLNVTEVTLAMIRVYIRPL